MSPGRVDVLRGGLERGLAEASRLLRVDEIFHRLTSDGGPFLESQNEGCGGSKHGVSRVGAQSGQHRLPIYIPLPKKRRARNTNKARIERVEVSQVPEGQRPRFARALAQAVGGLNGLQIVGFGGVYFHKGQQCAQLNEHHRPGGMDTAALETEPESLQLLLCLFSTVTLLFIPVFHWHRHESLEKAGLLDDVARRLLCFSITPSSTRALQPRLGLRIGNVQRGRHFGVFHRRTQELLNRGAHGSEEHFGWARFRLRRPLGIVYRRHSLWRDWRRFFQCRSGWLCIKTASTSADR